MADMDPWGLLRVSPNAQVRYLGYLAERQPEVETYTPMYDRVSRPSGLRHTITVPTPVYPGYIFVKLCVDLRSLLSYPIRAYFVRFGGQNGVGGSLGTIREMVINGLKDMEQRGELVREDVVENPYKPGRKVRIHTPVASINGIIKLCTHSGSRATVDTALGSWNVPIHQVELV